MILQRSTSSFALLLLSSAIAGLPGKQQARPFDEGAAKKYLRYARVAFCAKSRVEAWNCGEDCEIVGIEPGSARFFGPTGDWAMQGYVAQLPQPEVSTCIVAVRGSVNIVNWIADLDFAMEDWPFPTQCPDCRVHAGFVKAYTDLKPHILAAMRDLRCGELVFAGHSLGAAMVTMASFEARAGYGIKVKDVWTYGKPRVGNEDWARHYIEVADWQAADPPLWRVVHHLDPAPHVPDKPLLGYLHENEEVWYPVEDSSTFTVCASKVTEMGVPIEDPACSAQHLLPICLLHASDHTVYLNLSFVQHDAPLNNCQDESLASDEVVIV